MPLKMERGTVLLKTRDGWLRFRDPVGEIRAAQRADVIPSLLRIEAAVERGLHGAGFLAYEAAPAFDSALKVPGGADFPLLWFGLYRERERLEALPGETNGEFSLSAWRPSISRNADVQMQRDLRQQRHAKLLRLRCDTAMAENVLLMSAIRADMV